MQLSQMLPTQICNKIHNTHRMELHMVKMVTDHMNNMGQTQHKIDKSATNKPFIQRNIQESRRRSLIVTQLENQIWLIISQILTLNFWNCKSKISSDLWKYNINSRYNSNHIFNQDKSSNHLKSHNKSHNYHNKDLGYHHLRNLFDSFFRHKCTTRDNSAESRVFGKRLNVKETLVGCWRPYKSVSRNIFSKFKKTFFRS